VLYECEGYGARGIEGRENQQKAFTDIDLVETPFIPHLLFWNTTQYYLKL